jgi:hypothetical protein
VDPEHDRALMPTTIDRFIAVYQLCQQIAGMQNDMRASAQIIQSGFSNPASELFNDLPLVQQRTRDAGAAYLSRIAVLTTLATNFSGDLATGFTALGISPTDVTALRTLLTTWATNLHTATITSQIQLNNQVAALLAAVPAAMQPY